MPLIRRLDSETVHNGAREALHLMESNRLTLRLLERLFTVGGSRVLDDRLRTSVGGLELENPLIVGAGWDKEGRSVRALWQLGFASVEVGTITRDPQKGNTKPRQFGLNDGVVINRLGFNSPGLETVAKNLERYSSSGIPIGVSLGINKGVLAKDAPEAHATVASRLYDAAAYLVINVSSPNTPGLRALQEKSLLTDNVLAVNQTMSVRGRRKPLFVKIAPELSFAELDDVIDVVKANNLAGIIATNTTTNPEIKAKYGEKWRNEPGGLSGDDQDYFNLSNKIISYIYRQTLGTVDIIGVGGVHDLNTALDKIEAGAKALQIVTGIRSEGPVLPSLLLMKLISFSKTVGAGSIRDFVGCSANTPRKFLPHAH